MALYIVHSFYRSSLNPGQLLFTMANIDKAISRCLRKEQERRLRDQEKRHCSEFKRLCDERDDKYRVISILRSRFSDLHYDRESVDRTLKEKGYCPTCYLQLFRCQCEICEECQKTDCECD